MNVSRGEFDQTFSSVNMLLRQELGNGYFEPAKYLCDEASCYFGTSEGFYFSDSNHLSDYGLLLIQNDLQREISQFIKAKGP